MFRNVFVTLFLSLIACNVRSCEQCKGEGANPINLLSSGLDDAYRSALRQPSPSKGAAPVGSTPKTPVTAEHPDGGTHSTPLTTPRAENTPAVERTPAEVSAVAAHTRWYFDTTFEFISYAHQSVAKANAIVERDRDTHAHIQEFDVTQRFAYDVNADLQVSLSQGFRSLYLKEIEDPDLLGLNERSSGATDLTFGGQYRFLHQSPCDSPCDVLVFGSVKAPTGTTNNRRPNGDLFETEDRPGTGSWNETLGLSVGKRWGEWGATAAYSYTHKGEGSQRFKEGDVNRLSLTASHRISPDDWSWRVYYSQGVQGFIENRARDHGEVSKDHGGQFIYAVPGISVQPNRHLIVTTNAAVPIYQQENGFHQKDRFALQFNVGVRF